MSSSAVKLCPIPIIDSIYATRVIGQSTTATAGNNASMFCQLVETKEKLTRITWQKRTRGTPINKDFFVITPDGKAEKKNGLGDRTEFIGNIGKINGTVLLKDVLLLDEGVYTCIFNIFPSGPFEKEIDLHVQVPPIVSVTTDVIPVVGESEVTLATCTASKALPAAEVSWHLGALNNSVTVKTIHYEDLDRTFTVKSYLIGVPSKDLNQQKVQCLVKHICLNEEVTLDYTLVIHYPPQVVYIMSVNATATSHEFQCVVDASPQPKEFIWSRMNEVLSNWADHDRLIIPLTSDNNGLYMCNVSNPYGNGTGTLYVHAFRASVSLLSCDGRKEMQSLPNYVLIIWVLFLSLLYSATTAIQVIGHSTFVNAGEDATLYCELVETKEKLKRITWQKRIRGVSINKDFFVITPDGKTENKNGLGDRTEFIGNIQKIIGTVLLKNVTLLDEGVYTCIFNTFPNGQFQAGIYLHVQAGLADALQVWKFSAHDDLRCPHYSLQGLAVVGRTTAVPDSDAGCEDALCGSSVEVGEDVRRQTKLPEPSQEEEALTGKPHYFVGVE
ncbi:hypothetical protein NFI96_001186 [Prochilodus magdalenae]|nr:hypothetical protein NFI96_001186 [Prochilodus magdalenae]